MRKACGIIIFLFTTYFTYSQSKVEYFQYAEEAFQNEDYAEAATLYIKMLDATNTNSRDITYPYAMKYYHKKPTTAADSVRSSRKDTAKSTNGNMIMDISEDYVYHQIALSSRLSYDYPNAELWYQRSVQNNSPDYPDERYWYAVSLMKNEKYKLATQQLDTFKLGLPKDNPMVKKANKVADNCKFGLNNRNQKKDIIEELDTNINKGVTSFGLTYSGDASVGFASSKIPVSNKKPLFKKGENTSLEIYTAKKAGKFWGEAVPMPEPINTDENEVPGVFSADGTKLFFTRTNPENKKECAIYMSKFLNDRWLTPFKLNENVNKEGYKSMQPALSPEGNRLYFVSDMPGGQGKMDIWYCTIDDKGNAGSATNMGKRINSTEDDVTPFFHKSSSTLFYSTDGQTGFGGLDVFKTQLNVDDSTWSLPKNMGAPINSSREDAYFVMDKDQKTGFLSSDRKTCKDCSGGSCYKVYTIKKEANKFSIHGMVYNSETNQPLPNSLLTFKDVHGDVPNFFVVTDSTGAYSRELSENIELFIKAQKNRFFADANSASTIGLTESTDIERDFFLAPIPLGEIVIPGIEYDYDRATLRPASIPILDDLVEFLNLNDNISVQINSHCDERGTEEYNMNLSVARAQSVVDYLLSKGIAMDRLLPKGYGKTQPVIPFNQIERMKTEEEKEVAHQRNRRTAFKPIKEEEIKIN